MVIKEKKIYVVALISRKSITYILICVKSTLNYVKIMSKFAMELIIKDI